MKRLTALLMILAWASLASGQYSQSYSWQPADEPVPLPAGVQLAQCPGGVCPAPANPPPAWMVAASVRVTSSKGGGSGVIWHVDVAAGRALVITNKHVVPSNVPVTVHFANKTTTPARWLGADSQADLAMLEIAADAHTPYVPLAAAPPPAGAPLWQIGYSQLAGTPKTGAWLGPAGFRRFDAKVYGASIVVRPGDSGSGVFTQSEGRLVALVYATDTANRAWLVGHEDLVRYTCQCCPPPRTQPKQMTPPAQWPPPSPSPSPLPPPTVPPAPGQAFLDQLNKNKVEIDAAFADLQAKVRALENKPPPPAGVNGKDGRDGLDGKNGQDGKNAPDLTPQLLELTTIIAQLKADLAKVKTTPGPIGPAGPPGPAGKDGDSSALAAQVAELKTQLAALQQQVNALPGEIRVSVEKKK